MNELINVKIEYVNDEFMANSRQVAADFNKDHDKVMRSIRELEKDVSTFGEMFRFTEMGDSYGRNQRVCLMNRDGFSLLAMGFTGSDATRWKVKYIEAFNLMEAELNSPERLMARALKLADKTIKSLEMKVEEMRPKEIFADAVSASADCILVRDLAKLIKQNGIDTGEIRLYKWMREHGYIIKGSTMPTQRAMNMKLFEIRETTFTYRLSPLLDEETKISKTTMVTGKGQQYFINKFLKDSGKG